MTFLAERAPTDISLCSNRGRFGALHVVLAALAVIAVSPPQLSAAIDPAQPASELLDPDQTHVLHHRLNDLHSPQSFGAMTGLLPQSCITPGSVQSVQGLLHGGQSAADPKIGDFGPIPARDDSMTEQKDLTRKPPRSAQATDLDLVVAALREMPRC
ncbi:hypothetical protein [Phaeobacter sp. HF9A]|uniref:hypothetical protein n=1 Tax=Phaeobacter sp. HF9A TaxID=2721561 RepID=UPI001431778E|nr:hypothetical protein [Phaeobacter sp. HF9A]NIZ13653.1 hypothetical protein [Phaeobacter sp. HF9A]